MFERGRPLRDGNRRADAVSASEEARPVGLELQLAGGLAFQHGQMGGPYLRFIRCPPSAGRQKRAEFRHEFGLHEKLRKCRMRRIIARGRQDDLGIRGQLDLARAHPKI